MSSKVTYKDEFKEKYLRALADYQNLERQTQGWKEEFARFASVDLIRKLLEVLDDLEKAQEHIKDQGLELVIAKLKKFLQDEGLEEIEVLGKMFDPSVAEVISTEPFDSAQGKPENTVAKVLQKGYKIGDKVIRVAKVVVWQR